VNFRKISLEGLLIPKKMLQRILRVIAEEIIPDGIAVEAT
jgi:hypothetical protein